MRADTLIDKCTGVTPTVIGIMRESSDLSRRLGAPITTINTSRRTRKEREGTEKATAKPADKKQKTITGWLVR